MYPPFIYQLYSMQIHHGHILKKLVTDTNTPAKDVADVVHITETNLFKWYKKAVLPLPALVEFSLFFKKNLLDTYYDVLADVEDSQWYRDKKYIDELLAQRKQTDNMLYAQDLLIAELRSDKEQLKGYNTLLNDENARYKTMIAGLASDNDDEPKQQAPRKRY